jgi:hypothetical protein
MEHTAVLELMGTLKLYGMRAAYDKIMGVAIKRQHETPRIVGDLLQADIGEADPLHQITAHAGQAAAGQGHR